MSPVSPFKVPICTFGTRHPWFPCNCSQGPMRPGAPAAGLGARAVWGRHQYRDDVGTIPEKWELLPAPVYMDDRRQPWASVLCTLIISLMASYQPPSGPPLPWSVHGTWLTRAQALSASSPFHPDLIRLYASLSNDISCLPACIFVLSPAISVSCCRCIKSPQI